MVGPEMLYSIVMELKFHLRDNFEGHIFNFTVYYILEQLDIQNGQVDYCLPLILPMVVDEVFGKTAEEKSLVDLN